MAYQLTPFSVDDVQQLTHNTLRNVTVDAIFQHHCTQSTCTHVIALLAILEPRGESKPVTLYPALALDAQSEKQLLQHRILTNSFLSNTPKMPARTCSLE